LLITHWGLSGPAVLKLYAFGARELAALQYNFTVVVNWLSSFNENSLRENFSSLRNQLASQKISNKNPFGLPQRLWMHFLEVCEINHDTRSRAIIFAQRSLYIVLSVYIRSFKIQLPVKTIYKKINRVSIFLFGHNR
jgi:predicted flavoprotein YhiN